MGCWRPWVRIPPPDQIQESGQFVLASICLLLMLLSLFTAEGVDRTGYPGPVGDRAGYR